VEIDILEEGKPLNNEAFVLIANIKNDAGGQALVQFMENKAKKATAQLIGANPNDAGAIAQLQAQIASLAELWQLIQADPAKYKESKDA
jgi:hypothetical protein